MSANTVMGPKEKVRDAIYRVAKRKLEHRGMEVTVEMDAYIKGMAERWEPDYETEKAFGQFTDKGLAAGDTVVKYADRIASDAAVEMDRKAAKAKA
ncbi:MAG: hypothetical protein QXD77_00805 [Candidatus Aenigmatarchaeota archaeon]